MWCVFTSIHCQPHTGLTAELRRTYICQMQNFQSCREVHGRTAVNLANMRFCQAGVYFFFVNSWNKMFWSEFSFQVKSIAAPPRIGHGWVQGSLGRVAWPGVHGGLPRGQLPWLVFQWRQLTHQFLKPNSLLLRLGRLLHDSRLWKQLIYKTLKPVVESWMWHHDMWTTRWPDCYCAVLLTTR